MASIDEYVFHFESVLKNHEAMAVFKQHLVDEHNEGIVQDLCFNKNRVF